MAKVLNPLLQGAVGQLADTTLFTRSGDTLIRTARSRATDVKSQSQMERRVRLANLVAFFRNGGDWQRSGFANKRRSQSDYNKFVSVNYNMSGVALTKDEVAQGACIVAPYMVTNGNLPSISVTDMQGWYASNILMVETAVSPSDTVAQFAYDLVNNNKWLRFGDQISCLVYMQVTNEVTGVPMVILNRYEVTLDPHSDESLVTYLPTEFFTTVSRDGMDYLGFQPSKAPMGFTFVLSRNTRRGLAVSTQILTMTNTSFLDRYTSEEHLRFAIQSYGQSESLFLSPESISEDKNAIIVPTLLGFGNAVTSISSIGDINIKFVAGSTAPTVAMYKSSSTASVMPLYLSAKQVVTRGGVTIRLLNGALFELPLSEFTPHLASPGKPDTTWGAKCVGLSGSGYNACSIVSIWVGLEDDSVLNASFPYNPSDPSDIVD